MAFRGNGQERIKGKPRTLFFPSSDWNRPSWLNCLQNRGFPLVAAGVPVLMMSLAVDVLMGMSHRLVAVLVAVMGMSSRLMGVLMLMLVLVVAAHFASLLSVLFR